MQECTEAVFNIYTRMLHADGASTRVRLRVAVESGEKRTLRA